MQLEKCVAIPSSTLIVSSVEIPILNTYRSKIRRALIDKLGQTLSNYYAINLVEPQNSQNLFKVNLTPEYLDIDVRFLD